MWQPGVATTGGDLPGTELKAVNDCLNEVIQRARLKLDALGLPGARLGWERPHSRFVWYGQDYVFVVGEPLSGAMATLVYIDGRQYENAAPQDIIALAQRDVGFRNPFLMLIPTPTVTLTGEARNAAIEKMAEGLIGDLIKQHELSEKLGIDETITYLSNAKRRMDEQTPEAMADVKTNCRNAVQSLILRLAGTTDFQKAMPILIQKGVFTKHEARFIEALAELLDAFFDVASWPGGHPPLPSTEDAKFVLDVTSATVNYIAERALAARS